MDQVLMDLSRIRVLAADPDRIVKDEWHVWETADGVMVSSPNVAEAPAEACRGCLIGLPSLMMMLEGEPYDGNRDDELMGRLQRAATQGLHLSGPTFALGVGRHLDVIDEAIHARELELAS